MIDDNGTTYSFDANGNRTFINEGGSGEVEYDLDTGNRLLHDGVWAYGYDDEGNVTSKTDASDNKWTYEYDHSNQFVAAEYYDAVYADITKTVEYRYDAFGNRLERLVGDGTSITATERFACDVPAPCQSPSKSCHRTIARARL